MRAALAVMAAIAIGSPVAAQEDPADFFRKDKMYWSQGLKAPAVPSYNDNASRIRSVSKRKRIVRRMVALQAKKKLGKRWVGSAVKIAYVESRFNPKAVGLRTRHGRARGVMQVMPGSARAMGFNPRRLNEAAYGIAAGIEHMRLCIASGVRTDAEMSACHVAGTRGWAIRLRKKAQRYKRIYVAMVRRAPGHWD
jgi:soluble lytic murein transglycosylase-like protein